ncbi:LOW QUALITY PROTEIN: major facilitator superfamily domain-containing protein 1-like [Lucilia sericata]|uniref:LOW QUALITY PROTEIN: major facilitator superfamily domain-containing protein 1-like n=1 Tax=Lucilia sericata TaxID=13632 RepID=UPI0018A85FDD|nr:LOW QUALITY PROTEIN: major facilitator superfamily domain-containing protein 1-like [Lucilia sericata]
MSDDNLPIVENEHQPASIRRGPPDNELDPQPTGCGASACCNPSSGFHRFLALIFMCLLGFGSYFCYDNPGALQEVFKKDLNITTTEFTLIYSIYSWPNVVLCFVGGFLIDRVFGIRLGTIIYLFILLIGQLLFASGGILGTFWIMIVGRFIFGIGAESLAVAQNNYAVLWFKGKELNMVFGLQLSVARFGSTVNFWVMQPIYNYVTKYYPDHRALGVVLLLAAGTCVMSLICALILGWMDKRAERILQRNNNPSGEIAKLSDITTFKVTFWMVSIICVAYYVAIFPFIALGKSFFMDKFHLTPDEANNVNSIVYLISAVASPLFGFIIDKTGRNVSWICAATLSTIGAHTLLAFTMLNPYVGMVLMGLSYSMLAASLWPLVALIIPEYQLGTAYGFCQSVQNLGLAVITILAGMIVDNSNGDHTYVELFFLGWLTIALISTCVIYVYDRKTGGNLNLTPAQRTEYNNAIAAARLMNAGDGVNNDEYASDQEPLLNN